MESLESLSFSQFGMKVGFLQQFLGEGLFPSQSNFCKIRVRFAHFEAYCGDYDCEIDEIYLIKTIIFIPIFFLHQVVGYSC